MTDAVEITVQSMLTGTERWDLVANFLKLRREVFIERMEWPLYQADSMEFEQYDRVDTYYLIAHTAGQVLGGARLLRTDRVANFAQWLRYMGNTPQHVSLTLAEVRSLLGRCLCRSSDTMSIRAERQNHIPAMQ